MRRSFDSRVFSLVAAFILLVSSVPPVPVHAIGEWCSVRIYQKKVSHEQGCTVCTLQLILQNSGTLKPEYQLSGDITSNTAGSKYRTFDVKCGQSGGISSGLDSDGSSKDDWRIVNFTSFASSVCADGVVWESSANISGGTPLTQSDWANCTIVGGIGGKKFKDMSYSEVITAMKLFWNSDYFCALGCFYDGYIINNNGPDAVNYPANHQVMFAGVDDTGVYINDPIAGLAYMHDCYSYRRAAAANGGTGQYRLSYLVAFKNNKTSPKSLAGGQHFDVSSTDSSNLSNMGLTDSQINTITSNNFTFTDASFRSTCMLSEQNLTDLILTSDTENLKQDDLEVLEGWRDNIDGNKNENGFIAVLRWLVQAVGILITIWALLIYMAFWFDHINSFVYLDALHILTLGQLHICPPGEKPTFALGKGKNDRTVSHWQIVCICLTAILFGAMLISGVFYSLVTKLIRIVTGFVWGS